MERKRFEARMVAMEIGLLLTSGDQQKSKPEYIGKYRVVETSEMLSRLGMEDL